MRVTSILIFLLSLTSTVAWNQEPEHTMDTTRVSLGDEREVIIVKKNDQESDTTNTDDDGEVTARNNDFTYWSGIDVGFSGLIVDDAIKDDYKWLDINESKSISFSLNILEKKIPIIKHYLGINTGLGFTWQDYVLNDTISFMNVNDTIMGVSSLPLKYEKNKLKTGYVRIPLLVEINTSKKKKNNFHIAAGFIGGWNFRSLLKQQSQVSGDKVKSKTKGDYNISPWSLEMTTRLGYGNFNVFASVGVTSLFADDAKDLEAYPFTVGMTILAF